MRDETIGIHGGTATDPGTKAVAVRGVIRLSIGIEHIGDLARAQAVDAESCRVFTLSLRRGRESSASPVMRIGS